MTESNEPALPNGIYQKMNALFSARNVANCAQHLIPRFTPDAKILDVGCGPGSITIDMAKNYIKSGRIHALDRNPESIATAKAAADQRLGPNHDINFIVGDANDLSQFPDDTFDIVHSHQVLFYLPDPANVLREMRRVCKPGGIVTTRDLATRWLYPPMPPLQRFQDIQNTIVSAHSGAPMERGGENHVWAHAAGFAWEEIEISNVGWGNSTREEKERLLQGLLESLQTAALPLGISTQEEIDAIGEAFEVWRKDPAGRAICLDSVVVCRK